jgi:hypothetical protein
MDMSLGRETGHVGGNQAEIRGDLATVGRSREIETVVETPRIDALSCRTEGLLMATPANGGGLEFGVVHPAPECGVIHSAKVGCDVAPARKILCIHSVDRRRIALGDARGSEANLDVTSRFAGGVA